MTPDDAGEVAAPAGAALPAGGPDAMPPGLPTFPDPDAGRPDPPDPDAMPPGLPTFPDPEAGRPDPPAPDADRPGPAAGLWAGAAGRVARDLLAVDWAATPLGPPQWWPRSLTTVVRAMLGSRFSMWLGWGPQLTFFCNDAYRRDTLGAKYPWALGRPVSQVWAEIWEDLAPRVERVLRTGTATWDEALQLFLERSGYVEETYHTFSYSPLADDEGRVGGLLCVVSEETERVIGERRMRTLRDLGSQITATGGEAEVLAAAGRHLSGEPRCLPFTLTYLFDEDGRAARLAATTGIADDHPAAVPVIDVGDPDAAWPVTAALGGDTVTVDDLARRYPTLPTGAWKQPPVRALVTPLPQPGGGRPYGFLVVGLNRYRPLDDGYRGFITLVAGQIAAAVAAARAYEAERRRAESLAELDRAKTAFFTNVSHEFRTPLTLMLGPAEDALADTRAPLPAPQRRRVEVVHGNALRLLTLVNSLLDFSRLESGRIAARFEPVDLPRYTAELAGMFQPAVRRAGLALGVDCPPLDAPVHVDREMWAKIVLNLLSNALKFTFSGGITVRLREVDGAAVLSVADTGVGIDPAQQSRLFERFHRVPGVRSRSHEGSGIGLALVAELAALHGGAVSVTSRPGRGSVFRVRVPLGTAHLPADQIAPAGGGAPGVGRQAQGLVAEAMRWLRATAATDANVAGKVAAGPDGATGVARHAAAGATHQVTQGGRARVLVVDDNADMRDYVADLLTERYDVRTAPDGIQALALARQYRPDLVLTDVMMPNLDGFGLLAALRADPVTALVPVVMLSARAGDEATAAGLAAGADDYLSKPFSARELLARVRSNIELQRTRRARVELERSRHLLDQAQRLARVGSWEVELATGAVTASEEFIRQVGIDARTLREEGFQSAMDRLVHPDDRARVRQVVTAAATAGAPLDYEVRLLVPGEGIRIFRTLGEPVRDATGRVVRLRGSNQDITEQRQAEQALASAAAAEEAAAREHRIADELQRSLLPAARFSPDHLNVATYYRAGVRDTQVGGDWFDVIELGADRTALVMGDVMGRGVHAAAVMGQLRAAVRAYARLDLPPADVLEFLDALVRDLGEDQIVTCVYAVYEPGAGRLAYANAGHLPPLLAGPGARVRRLSGAAGPPLGTGPFTLTEERVDMPPGAILALYTDGLVEHRDRDIETGIEAMARQLGRLRGGDLDVLPEALVASLRPDERDDIALLLASVDDQVDQTVSAVWDIPARESAVSRARLLAAEALRRWDIGSRQAGDIVLLVSELVTNAVLHGRPPIELLLRRTPGHVVVEVHDRAAFLPRKLRPSPEDEHGRGLQLVALVADRWGTRPTPDGKSVWCVFTIAPGRG